MKAYSNILKILFISFLTLWVRITLPAQQPAYFTIGQEDLKDDKIYTLYQGDDEIIYVGSNNGLFVYKHGKFTRIKDAPQQIRSAIFNLKKNYNNELFCMNYSGQIFKLVDNRLVLFFQVPSESLSSHLEFHFNGDNDLIIMSHHLLKVSNKTKAIKIYKPDEIENVTLSKQLSPNHFIFRSVNNHILELKNDIITPSKLFEPNHLHLKKEIFTSFIPLDSSILSLYYNPTGEHQLQSFIYNGTIDTKELKCSKNGGIFQFENNKNEFFCSARKKGLTVYEYSNHKINNKGLWFPDEFISTIFSGSNGQILLGTFGNGIHIVPNRNIIRRNIIPSTEKCYGLCSIKDTLFFTTDANNIYSFHTDLRLRKHYEHSNVLQNIFYADGFDFFKSDGTNNLIYDNLTYKSKSLSKYASYSSLKDVWRSPSGIILIAHRNGLSSYNLKNINHESWGKSHEKNIFNYFKPFIGRVDAVSYSPESKTIYASHKGQVHAIDSNYSVTPLQYHNQDINCWDLFYHDKTLYIASQKHGILVLENDSIYSKYNTENGLSHNYIEKITIFDNRLFLANINGLQVINLKNNKITTIGPAEGIAKGKIADFDINGDILWILRKDEILSLHKDNLPQSNYNIALHLDSININDKRINLNQNSTFNYQQKKFDFHLDFRTVILQNETDIFYKLEGLDENWTKTNIEDYIISYKALPSGNYTFRAYAEYRNKKSAEIIYSFKINPPIWQRWWFYILSILFISAIFYSFYNNRMKQLNQLNQAALEQEKSKREKQVAEKEMIESELKALRSQMNPHFIFNSLNSIQDLILREETDKSYDYIVLFADLVRSTLNHSNKKFISAEKELEFLNTYLSLEKLRFKEDFNYLIRYTGSKDIQIPSLVVQPFIENALLHGLLHKKGKKQLDIHFEVLEDIIICSVIDNGIGRERAKEIRQRQRANHQSFSMEAIKKRLVFLNKQYSVDSDYEFIDLEEEGISKGTKVLIKMPYKHLF